MTVLLAQVADLQARLARTLDGDELVRAVALLGDASALAHDVAGRPDWTDPDSPTYTVVPHAVRAVVLRSVERAIRNPLGVVAESSGDYTFQRRGAQDGVYLTDAEQRVLRRAVGRSGLSTIGTTRGDDFVSG